MQKVKISKRVGRQLYRSSPTILTVVASVGVVTTTIMAVRATPKAIKILKEAELEKGEDLSKLEIIRAAGPIYIPSVLLGVSTIACIFGANALNQKKQASLMSAYAMLNESYKQYRKAAKTVYGEDADDKIHAEMAKDAMVSTYDWGYQVFLFSFFDKNKSLWCCTNRHNSCRNHAGNTNACKNFWTMFFNRCFKQ